MESRSRAALRTVGIMQPYFLPHFSYFQLIANSNIFCLHDKVKYTKQSWINRNRIVVNKNIRYITLPVKSGSDYESIDKKQISSSFEKSELLDIIDLNYRKSPYFNDVFPIMRAILSYESKNLFVFVSNSIQIISDYLNIGTKIIKSSDTSYNTNLTKSHMVIDICKRLHAEAYLNPEGGMKLYDSKEFLDNGIRLRFAKRWQIVYRNRYGITDGTLSILDVLMWNSRDFLIDQLFQVKYLEG